MTLPDPLSSPISAADPAAVQEGDAPPAAAAELPPAPPELPPGFAPFPVWLVPAWPQAQGGGPLPGWPLQGAPMQGYPVAAPPPAPATADPSVAHNQRLLILGIVAAVALVHLPWLLYLFAVQGCWGSFIDLCGTPPETGLLDSFDSLSDTPFLFARVAFFMLRVQAVLSSDWAQFSQVLQVSTGLGSFLLTKIIAANGKITQGNVSRMLLAGTCAAAFVVLFWAEIHLTGTSTYPELGDQTVLGYIDQELPEDFVSAVAAKSGLMQYLQILRLADALILGAALAMPKSAGKAQ